MDFLNEAEPQYQGIFADWFKDEVSPDNVETYKTDITGVDGNVISLNISEPTETESEIPAI